MKILYLHGYKARPNYERIGYLEELGHEVIAPYIKYDTEPNILIELLEQDYDMVVGSSLGAYMAFYISDYKSVPCVCFNPPLFRDLKIEMKLPENWDYESVIPQYKDIVVGGKDDVVDAIDTINWLTENRPTANVHILDDMTHTIKMGEFVGIMNMVLSRHGKEI